MKKIIEIDSVYYRINLGAGNIIYFSHAKDVHDNEYIDLGIRDVIGKIDELVEAYNSFTKVLQDLGDAIPTLKNDLEDLKNKVLGIEDKIAPEPQ